MPLLRAFQPLRIAALAVATAVAAAPALADYPERPVNVINTWAPGGPSDAIIRPILEKFGDKFGQPFVLENKSGANGSIGSDYVARAPKTGYVLLFANVGPIAISPSLPDKPRYDSLRDFQPIGQIVSAGAALVVAPNFPANNLKEFIEYARKNPDKISYGSVGNGSSTHIAGATLASQAGVKMVHVPYRGSAQIQVDIMGGQIQAAFVNLGGALELIRAGKLKALAVSTKERSQVMPDLQPVAEVIPGFDFNFWYGLMAPAGTPPEVVAKLSAGLKEVMEMPDIRKRMLDAGLDPQWSTPAAYGQKIQNDIGVWKKALDSANITW